MFAVNNSVRMGRVTPLVTILLIFVGLVVQLSQLDASLFYISTLRHDLGFIPARDFALSLKFLFHAVSYQFLHANWGHFLLNMLALWVFGVPIESGFRRGKFLLFYLACGVGAIVTQSLFDSAHLTVPVMGASGSVAGLMAAYLLLFGRTRLWVLLVVIPVRLPAFAFILIWFGLNLFSALTDSDSNIAFLAHLGGFLFGLLACFLLKPANMKFLQKL